MNSAAYSATLGHFSGTQHNSLYTDQIFGRNTMSNLLIRDLSDSSKLDRHAMARVRGGMFGGIFKAMANYASSRNGSSGTGPTVSGVTVTKTMDSTSNSL